MKNMYTGIGGKTHFEEDIPTSVFREVKEETGIDVHDLELKGVLKTILEGKNSSWILFVYIAKTFSQECSSCDEGELQWIDRENIHSLDLIGFIREIISFVLDDIHFIEGCIHHDAHGNVLQKKISIHTYPGMIPKSFFSFS